MATRTGALSARPYATADSRGRPTVAVELALGAHRAVGDVPAGASKGADEAQTVPVPQAIAHIGQIIVPLLQRLDRDLADPATLAALEEAVVARAGDNFGVLGANATLPVSRALWALAAQVQGVALHVLLRRAQPQLAAADAPPTRFLMNIFNGGLHALRPDAGEVLGRDRIAVQEIMVVPVSAPSYRAALTVGERIDAALAARLRAAYGAEAVSRADEAGFSVRGLGEDDVAIAHVVAAIEAAGLHFGRDVKLALDVAATSFYDAASRTYALAGRRLDADGMCGYLDGLAARYAGGVFSIEDGLAENDWDAWARHSAAMSRRGVLTVGDDLFVTQHRRLQRGIAERSAHAILIKVNQNGTVHGTLQVMQRARAAGMACIVSHRSGETLDASIADLAFASAALGLKSGDPQPPDAYPDPASWVRRVKYLRMVALEEGG